MKTPKTIPLSRRGFLKLSAATSLGLALSACGIADTKISTPQPTLPKDSKIATDTPPIIPEVKNFDGTVIDTAYLNAQGIKIASILKNDSIDFAPLPNPVPKINPPIPSGKETPSQLLSKDIKYASAHWGKELGLSSGQSKSGNALDVLRLLISKNSQLRLDQAVLNWANPKSGVSESLFANSSLYSERLNLINFPELGGQHILKEGYPQGLVIKDKSRLTVVGRNKITDGTERVVIVFEEYSKREDGTTFVDPRLRFAVLLTAEFSAINKDFLLNQEYLTGEDHITFTDATLPSPAENQKRAVKFNVLGDDVMQAIEAETKGLWVEKYADPASGTKFSLFPQPFLRYPDPKMDVLPSAIGDIAALKYETVSDKKLEGKPESVKVQAKDASEKVVLEALYSEKDKRWEWDRPSTLLWKSPTNLNEEESFSDWHTPGWSDIKKIGGTLSFVNDPEKGNVLEYEKTAESLGVMRVQVEKHGTPLVTRQF